MKLSIEEQKRMLKEVLFEYDAAKIVGHFEGWICTPSFDRHNPCQNVCFTTPSGTEIKVFLPNSTSYCVELEQLNYVEAWIGDNGFPEDFDNEEVLIDYLVEQENHKLI